MLNCEGRALPILWINDKYRTASGPPSIFAVERIGHMPACRRERTELSINHSEFRRWELFTAPLNGCRIRRAVFLLPYSTNTTAIKDSKHHKAFRSAPSSSWLTFIFLQYLDENQSTRSLLELLLLMSAVILWNYSFTQTNVARKLWKS